MVEYLEKIREEISEEFQDKLAEVAKAEEVMAKYSATDFVDLMENLNVEIEMLQRKYTDIQNAKCHAANLEIYGYNPSLSLFIDLCQDMLKERTLRYNEIVADREFLRGLCKHEKDKYKQECKICQEYMP